LSPVPLAWWRFSRRRWSARLKTYSNFLSDVLLCAYPTTVVRRSASYVSVRTTLFASVSAGMREPAYW
jgi:hypothetical protein